MITPGAVDQTALMPHILQRCGCNSVVECQLPKLDVAGSSPVTRSISSVRASPAPLPTLLRGFVKIEDAVSDL